MTDAGLAWFCATPNVNVALKSYLVLNDLCVTSLAGVSRTTGFVGDKENRLGRPMRDQKPSNFGVMDG